MLSLVGTLEGGTRYTEFQCFDPFPFLEGDDVTKARIGALSEEIDAHCKRAQAEHGVTLTQMYNVLEKVKSGAAAFPLAGKVSAEPTDGGGAGSARAQNKAAALGSVAGVDAPPPPSVSYTDTFPAGGKAGAMTPAEYEIFDKALILTLKHLHDELDAAVAYAYGWPRDLGEPEVLARLVALNKARAGEEARGLVRWLRPDYQIPRFGSTKEKAELELVGGAGDGMTQDKAASAKPNFPANDTSQTVAVTMALMRASGPISAGEIARQFKQGKKIEPRIEFTLRAMARLGDLSSSEDGKRFMLKRAA